MKYSLSWLTDYVTIKSDAETLSDKLTMTTAEMEQIIDVPLSLQSGLVAEVMAVEPHPNADRLRLVTVKTSRGKNTVVCGAPNVAVGQKVPFLPAGSYYAGDGGSFCQLQTATIRGVSSAGMLASEHDLGLSTDHSGIMILPSETPIASSLAKACGYDQPVIELEITPNRGDLLSYWGLAREVAFIEKTRLKEPPLLSLKTDNDTLTPNIKIESDGCRRYTALIIDGLQNGPSPAWLQLRLRQSGIEPIDIIVDVTNYVMLELGQPLHAFDWHRLTDDGRQNKIVIRAAKSGESLACLDKVTRRLSSSDLVIANEREAVAMAGLIGGSSTAVHEGTTRIVLESASFDAPTVRRMSKRHNLRTEAVTRFEKGVDTELPVRALKRAAYLLKEIAAGEPLATVADSGQKPARHRQISVDIERAAHVLGLPVTKATVRQLCQIGFEISDKKSTIVEVTVPSWREDVTIEEDIYEEIVRLGGYDYLPTTIPSGPIRPTGPESLFGMHRELRRWLAANGYREVLSQAFISDEDAKRYDYKSELVTISNPPTRHESFARPDLLPIMLNRLAREALGGATEIASFEIGHTFRLEGKHLIEGDRLAIAVLTMDAPAAARQLKGVLESIGQALQLNVVIEFGRANHHKYLDVSESVLINHVPVGLIGLANDELRRSLKIRGRRQLVAAEIDLSPLAAAVFTPTTYAPAAAYPGITRDLALRFAPEISFASAYAQAIKLAEQPLQSVTCLEVCDDERKGFTLRLRYQLADRTLTDQEVEQALSEYLKRLKDAGLSLAK